MKKLLSIFCFTILTNYYGNCQTAQTTNDTVYSVVEQLPIFPGGEDSLKAFIASHIKYPEAEKINGTEAVIYVGFVVNKEGKVTNPQILKGGIKNFDDEALRVIALLPTWQPGKQAGEKVNVQYNIPIRFSLGVKDEKKKKK